MGRQPRIKAMNRGVLRSLAKTATWRILASADTFLIAGLITGDWSVGLAIAGIEVLTKMVLYFIHERVWARVGRTRYNGVST